MTELITSILDTVANICGRRLCRGDPPITNIKNNSNVTNWPRDTIFWFKADDIIRLTVGEHPPQHISSTYVQIPKSRIQYFDSRGHYFYVAVTVLKVDPFWWDRDKKYPTANVLNIDFMKPSFSNFFYQTHTMKSVLNNGLELSYVIREPEKMIFVGNVTMPAKPRDKAVLSFKFQSNILKKLSFYFNFTLVGNKHLAIKVSKNLAPDYSMLTKKPDFIVSNVNNLFTFSTGFIKNTEDFFYLGLLPQEDVGEVVNFQFESFCVACLLWEHGQWSTRYCEVRNANKTNIDCICNHLSGFTSTALASPGFIMNVPKLPTVLPVNVNWIIVAFLVFLLLLLFLLGLLFYLWDVRDRLFQYIIVLEDCIPGERYPYLLGAYTGNKISCGTSATVAFQLHGSEGATRTHILKCSWRSVLNEGSDDWFVFFTPESVGEIDYLEIWQDFSGKYPSWYCRQIVVFDLIEYTEYVFLIEAWLTVYLKEDAVLYHTADVATEEEINNRWRLAQNNVVYSWRDGHLVVGMFYRHPRSSFHRVERWVVLYLMILIILTMSLYFYKGFNTIQPDDYELYPRLDDVLIAINALLFAIPVVFILSYCFRLSRSVAERHYDVDKSTLPTYDPVHEKQKEELEEKEEEAEEKEHGELNTIKFTKDSERLSYLNAFSRKAAPFFMIQPFVPVTVTAYPRLHRYRINRYIYILAWAITIFGIIVLSLILFIYATRLKHNKGIKWIFSLIFALLFDILIIEVLVLLLCGLITAYIFKIPYNTTKIKIVNRPEIRSYYDDVIDNVDYADDLRDRRGQACYAPLAVKRERLIRSQIYQFWLGKWSIIDTLILFVYLCAFIQLLSNLQIKSCSVTTNTVERILIAPTNSSFGLNDVFNNTMFLHYLSENLVPKLHTIYYYNGRQLENERAGEMGYLSNYFHILTGVPLICQKRVKQNTCKTPTDIPNNTRCNSELNGDSEDKSPLTFHSSDFNSEIGIREAMRSRNTSFSRALFYTEGGTFADVMYGGSGTIYDSSGFRILLAKNSHNSLKILNDVKENNLIDSLTRVVIVEVLFYNVHTNMFTAFYIIAEDFANSIFIIKAGGFTWAIQKTNVIRITSMVIIMIVVFIMLIRMIYLLQLFNYLYFSHVSFILYSLAVVSGIIAIFVWVIKIYLEELEVSNFRVIALTSDTNVSFFAPLFRERLRNGFLALFTFFAMLRILFYVQQRAYDLHIFTGALNYFYGSALLLFFVLYCLLTVVGKIIILLQNPDIPCPRYIVPTPYHSEQMIADTEEPETIFYAMIVCTTSRVALILFRVLSLYYFACAKFNFTSNLLILTKNWKIGNLPTYFMHAFQYEKERLKRLRGGSDDINLSCSRRLKFLQSNSSFLTEKRLRDIQRISIEIISRFNSEKC